MNKILFLDNQDSFTYNLVEELVKLDFEVEVYRNTLDAQAIIDKVHAYQAEAKGENETPLLFLSPGPGTPRHAGCMMALLQALVGKVPILGVCLGHQALAQHYGGDVVGASETMHGKSSLIQLQAHPIFEGLGQELQVARYHSLVVQNLPSSLKVIGQYNQMPMCIINEKDKALGFQFHPESILTTQGSKLLGQSLRYLLAN